MRRYLKDIDFNNIKKVKKDVVIIGTGIAGLYCAYNLSDRYSITILTKEEVTKSSSSLAQGGIAAVIDEDDRIEFHYEDTIIAGAGIGNKEAVKVIVNEGPKDIYNIMKIGVNFDHDEKGNLHMTMEGGHSKKRILHSGGDSTGKEIVEKLIGIVDKMENVEIVENSFGIDLITEDKKVYGILCSVSNEDVLYITSNVVISTGGIGQVYKFTTNPLVATGDGIAMAMRAGARLNNMEFVQFHPTGLYEENPRGRSFLITEAIRGEGGKLLDQKGKRFMDEFHERGELAPRDIVARGIFAQMKKDNSEYVYLDITEKDRGWIKNRFPTIYKHLFDMGVDIAKEYIKVCPVQHYIMGGIVTDLYGETEVGGLYACGEAACTGVHGANRLASNSTLECLVFARRCATDINIRRGSAKKREIAYKTKQYSKTIDSVKTIENIKEIMTKYGGIIRNKNGLEIGIGRLTEIKLELDSAKLSKQRDFEAYNMVMVSLQILRSALERTESLGAHFRED